MNTDTVRESFEKENSYPLSDTWNVYVRIIDNVYTYVANKDGYWDDDAQLVKDYQNKWIGYQKAWQASRQAPIVLPDTSGSENAFADGWNSCLNECAQAIRAAGYIADHFNIEKGKWQGTFKPDERLAELEKRVREYYAIAELLPNSEVMAYSRALNDWRKACGYTAAELKNTKVRFEPRVS